ncbi:VanW family protein [Alkaliphilus transvaalensis]|uniref:VanW family protein n=1 Tax=Alkaliphilus transvaalensis TaxID=114628 RepID=UPI0004788184|nr:VanW family protein [Alkaliphilus transvaalensis]
MEPSVIKKSRKKLVLWVSGAILLSFIATLITLGILVLNSNTIYENVYIESIDVSHLTQQDAKLRLESIFEKERERHHLKMKYEEKIWDVSYDQIGFNYLYDDAIQEAFNVGRGGNYFNRLGEIYRVRKKPIIIPLKTEYNFEYLEEIVDEINKTIFRAPLSAKIERKNQGFDITNSTKGVEVDEEALKKELRIAIENYQNETVMIPVQYVEPKVTEDQLAHITDVMGSFSTVFDSQVTGRSTNISLASRSINGTLLMPGEVFSFNDKTGPRGVAEGYQEAPVILNGKLVPGIGGGICQVSTTLYNALVRADLEITKRQNHSLSVAYVPLGHDAAVAYGFLDLQFVNNTQHPIYVESSVAGNRISVNIYGKEFKDYSIKLFSEVVETIEPTVEVKKDPSLYIGDRKTEREAKRGYKVNTYKIYERNGQEFMKELISKDTYSTVNGLVLEGTKPRPQVQEDSKPDKEDNHEDIPTDQRDADNDEL